MDKEMPRILVVDDEKFYIDVLVNLLQDDYRVSVAKNGQAALKRAFSSAPPDLILLDVLMPDIDGYEVCRQLKENPKTHDIPVIFLTVKSEVDDEIKGFDVGAVDYISKPMSPPIVKSRVKNHLVLNQARKILQDQTRLLEQQVKERTMEICRTQDVAIYCMASLAETRDNETGNHIRRTQHYVRLLSEFLKTKPAFSDYLDDKTISLLFKSAPLHDIGKVGVPDSILLKPGKLDKDEWLIMQGHSQIGHDALYKAEQELGSSSFLEIARVIALTHHERWDGSGYPQGLKATDIPIAGRLMAIADVYDALISKRVYKEAFSHEKAVELILSEKGTHFDPDIVDAFEQLKDEFQRVAVTFKN
jgi:putative two-component system response regulator